MTDSHIGFTVIEPASLYEKHSIELAETGQQKGGRSGVRPQNYDSIT